MDLSLVKYRAQQRNNQRLTTALDNELRVLQEYQFNCSSTNITSLILGIDVRRATGSRTLFPSVQVFRSNGDPVTGSERTIYYSTSNVSTSGVYEYPLNPPISVTDEDLLAVSQPSQQNSVVRVYYSNELILVYPVTGKTPVFTKLKLKKEKLAVVFSFVHWQMHVIWVMCTYHTTSCSIAQCRVLILLMTSGH